MKPVIRLFVDGPEDRRKESDGTDRKLHNESVFNKQEFIERLGGDQFLMHEVVRLFVDTARDQIEALKKAIDGGDTQMLEQQSHALKGASASVAAESMRSKALEIERTARRGKLVEARRLVTELEDKFKALKTYLAKSGLMGSR